MSEPALRYPEWKAPAEDGQTLIWPEPSQLLADTIENQKRLSSSHSITLQKIPLPEVRAAVRRSIGHTDDHVPLIATGHQTELYHPGVWAKLALIDCAAANFHGGAIHFAVDTDGPKHLTLRWPGKAMPITDDPAITRAAWCGLLKAPGAKHLENILTDLTHDAESFGYQPIAVQFLNAMRRLTAQSRGLALCLADATDEIDASLG